MEKNIFPQRLKKLRTDREMSQATLAKALKTYQQNVAKWEIGDISPNMETLVQIAVIFDVTTDYLVGLSNDISRINENKQKIK